MVQSHYASSKARHQDQEGRSPKASGWGESFQGDEVAEDVHTQGEAYEGGRMNRKWHAAHPMPTKATFEQRCRWHSAHAKTCGCRPVPRSIAEALRAGTRRLADLDGVGVATLKDFDRLGIGSVAQLAKADPQKLYDRLCRLTGIRQDPCVLDVFTCAIVQARDPRSPKAQRKWWYWSRIRKAES